MALSKKYYENEKRLSAVALLHQITNIHVDFDGGGDSGQIEDIRVVSSDPDFKPENVLIRVWCSKGAVFDRHTKEWEEIACEEKDLTLPEFLHRHVNCALADTNVDWYNTNGGFGFWEWNPQNGLEFIIQVRYSKTISMRIEARELGSPKRKPPHVARPDQHCTHFMREFCSTCE